MKKFLIAVVMLVTSLTAAAAPFRINGMCTLSFSPNGGATTEIIKRIDAAKTSIYVMSYSFTSDVIAAALVRASERGVPVQMVVDGKQLSGRGSDVRSVDDAGLDVWLDKKHPIHHNKVMVIDSRIFINGSFNFSVAAEKSNAENLLVCPSTVAAKKYIENFELHKSHSIELNDTNFPRN